MKNLSYRSVPFYYLHCLNPSCVRSVSCPCHLVVQHAPAEVTHIMVVNPANYPAEADRCTYFRSTKKRHYAWGISSLFDNIPYKRAVCLKRKMHDLYPRTTCYRILHQERVLLPGEQEEIVTLFLQTGIDEVLVSDRYINEYN